MGTGKRWLLPAVVGLLFLPGAAAFIDSPNHPPENYTLSAVHHNAWIAVLQVERVDLERGVVVYEVAERISGRDWPARLRHFIKLDGKVPADLQQLRVGQQVLCFAWDRQFTLLVTFVGRSWYLSLVDREDPTWCRITGLRPDLNCLFVGSPAELAEAFRELRAGREIIARCQKTKKDPATQFVYCVPARPRSKEPVPALSQVAAKLPLDPDADARAAVPALLEARRDENRLVRATAERLLKRIDPEAASKAPKP